VGIPLKPMAYQFSKQCSQNKNAGLVGPAASLSLICGERLVTSLSPRIS
jgi:hypothetical protein